MNVRVTIDPQFARRAREYAAAAVEMAARHGDALDYSERSVAVIEGILDEIARAFAAGEVEKDRAWRLAMTWGSYLGEVFVRSHGGEWGVATVDGDDAVCVSHAKVTFWPWVRAMQRITNGPEENVWHYYKQLARDALPPIDNLVHRLAQIVIDIAPAMGDFEERTLEVVEKTLARHATSFAAGKLTRESAKHHAEVWGSFFGEVFRRTHGGAWERSDRGACLRHPRVTFWPWNEAFTRIVRGAPADMIAHYRELVAQSAG